MITEKINKLTLPATILIASIVLGGFFYASQVNKQRSIERQQQIKLQDDRRAEEVKAEQTKKEYVAKRKLECYDIEQRERKNYNNVDGSFYDEENDVCEVSYKNKKWKEGDPFFGGLVDTDGDGTKDTYKEGKYFTNEF